MSFDRTAVKRPEDLILDDELEDSSLVGKYACHNLTKQKLKHMKNSIDIDSKFHIQNVNSFHSLLKALYAILKVSH